MKVWDLERDYDRFIGFVVQGRQKKKEDIRAAVERVRREVLEKGEAALFAFSKKWDKWERAYPLKLTARELQEKASEVPKKDLGVLKGMIGNTRRYHRTQGGQPRVFKRKDLLVKEEFVPVEAAMVYVPGGTAAYPSSLIMGVVPAQLAGVREIFVTTPAPRGAVNPHVAAAALLLGVKHVYRIGGAQAIYAFSYGIGSVPKVDMIVGPGNAFVEEAKRDVYGRVGIDMLAGPTELIILCTEAFSPECVAWDMLSQAEHDEMATVGMFSRSRDHIYEVLRKIEVLATGSERKDVIEKALKENGFMVLYRDVNRAIDAVNRIAPEHMELIGNEKKAERVMYPGIIYLGRHTPVAMGDYYIGTNHILPTGGAGRFTAGLSVDRFMKRKVVVKLEKGFLERYGESAARLAQIEGLFAHGQAIMARRES
jgi:histidinol dehydrogenase